MIKYVKRKAMKLNVLVNNDSNVLGTNARKVRCFTEEDDIYNEDL